jgi:unsaturated rhamnogalacturonyl hydrolase
MQLLQTIHCTTIAELIFQQAKKHCDLTDYAGILTLNSLGRLALEVDSEAKKESLIKEARMHYHAFLSGKATFKTCNFQNYRCGGNGAAYLWWKGELPEASEADFLPYVDEILHEAPRDSNGIMCHPQDASEGKIFIDIAFAVTPFLLYCGLAMQRDDLISRAWTETKQLIDALIVPDTGLVNQAINYRGPGHRTQDHWSRGNGWAMHALSALVESLPEKHPDRPEVESRFVAFVDACLKYQDQKRGLWHQEMTMPQSYVETSGSGLILHAIGIGLAKGLLNQSHREAFERGLRGYIPYIAIDGSIHNTCMGCLSPDMGTKEDYCKRESRLNDKHAFGPAILALAQAHAIGIKTITL